MDRVDLGGARADPEEGEMPTIVAEFVSAGKVNQERDYVVKRAEYREVGVRQYWVIDRFRRTLTVYDFGGEKDEEQLIPEGKTYRIALAPRLRAGREEAAGLRRSLGEEEAATASSRSAPAGTAIPLPPKVTWRPRTLEHRSSAW